MYYIFSKTDNKFTMSCSSKPNIEDLEVNNLFAVYSETVYPISATIMYDSENNSIYLYDDTIDESFSAVYGNAIKGIDNAVSRLKDLKVSYGGATYQMDAESMQKMLVVKEVLNENNTIQWIAYDNSIKELSREDIANIILRAAQKNTEYSLRLREIKNAVLKTQEKFNSNLLSEQEAIDILSGFIKELDGILNE